MSPAGEAAVLWALLLLAFGVARWRFVVLRDRVARAPLENLRIEGVRRGVTSVVALAFPGLSQRWRADPAGSYHLTQRVHRLLVELAAEHDAEVEVPREDGFRLFLGRFRAHPEHRPAALALALEARERCQALCRDLDRDPPGLAVVTGDTLSAPVPLPGGEVVRASWGNAPARALELAAAAAPGEIRLDAPRQGADAGFRVEEGPPCLLLGAADEPGEVDRLSASTPGGLLDESGAEDEPLELSDATGDSRAEEVDPEDERGDEGRG